MFTIQSTNPTSTAELKLTIRDIPDFPKSGILFKDITPLLANPNAFREVTDRLTHIVRKSGATVIAGLESRGFIFGSIVASELKLPFIPIRKPGKLPADTVEIEYNLEYGSGTLQMHRDAFEPGEKVAIIDDLLATGGTAFGAGKLIEKIGGNVAGIFCVIELMELKGRDNLEFPVHSILQF